MRTVPDISAVSPTAERMVSTASSRMGTSYAFNLIFSVKASVAAACARTAVRCKRAGRVDTLGARWKARGADIATDEIVQERMTPQVCRVADMCWFGPHCRGGFRAMHTNHVCRTGPCSAAAPTAANRATQNTLYRMLCTTTDKTTSFYTFYRCCT